MAVISRAWKDKILVSIIDRCYFSRLRAGCICDAGGCHLRTSVGARVWVLLKEKGEGEADGGSSCDKSESGGRNGAGCCLPSCLPPPPPPPPPPPSLSFSLSLSLLLCGDLVIVYFLSCLAGSFCLINEQHLNRTKRAEEIAFNSKKVSLTFPSLHPHYLIFLWGFFSFLFFCLFHFEQGRWQCLVVPLRQGKQS